jgi:hypothetical protein
MNGSFLGRMGLELLKDRQALERRQDAASGKTVIGEMERQAEEPS